MLAGGGGVFLNGAIASSNSRIRSQLLSVAAIVAVVAGVE